jgi:hypothetical protein
MSEAAKSFIDTSVAWKSQVGHAHHMEYLAKTIPREWYVNNYVRMEYYSTLLMTWTQLYFESGEKKHPTFGDALNYFSDKFGRIPKSILTAVSVILRDDGFAETDSREKEFCRQKLQDLIFEMALQFEKEFVNSGDDPTHCSRIRNPLQVPDDFDRDRALLAFHQTFNDLKDCRNRCRVNKLFQTESSKAKFAKIASTTPTSSTKKQIAAVTKASQDPAGITCRSCQQMGDSIIACSLDSRWKLHSLDGLQGVLAKILEFECTVHPSSQKVVDGYAEDNDPDEDTSVT